MVDIGLEPIFPPDNRGSYQLDESTFVKLQDNLRAHVLDLNDSPGLQFKPCSGMEQRSIDYDPLKILNRLALTLLLIVD